MDKKIIYSGLEDQSREIKPFEMIHTFGFVPNLNEFFF